MQEPGNLELRLADQVLTATTPYGLQVYRFVPRFASLLYEWTYPPSSAYLEWFEKHAAQLDCTRGLTNGTAHQVIIDTVQRKILHTGDRRTLRSVLLDVPVPFSIIFNEIADELREAHYEVRYVPQDLLRNI